MTDKAIMRALSPVRTEVQFVPQADFALPHPNTMDLFAYKDGRQTTSMRVVSIGGGDIVIEGREETLGPDVYPENSFAAISTLCKANHIRCAGRENVMFSVQLFCVCLCSRGARRNPAT